MESSENLLARPLLTIGDTPTTLGALLAVCTVVVATLLIGRAARRAVRSHYEKQYPEQTGAFGAYGIVAQLLIWLIGLDLALHLLGIQLTSILAAGGFLAIGAGFAAKNVIENFLSGLILRWERTIHPGDIIIVSGKWLVIRRIGVRATEAMTYEGEDIIIPNSLITQSLVENLTRKDRAFRLDFRVGVAYESDLSVVKKTLEQTINALDWKSKNKSSWVRLAEFGESSVNYRIVVWIDDVDDHSTRKAELLEAIWWSLKDNGITIAYPQLDVHLDQKSTDAGSKSE